MERSLWRVVALCAGLCGCGAMDDGVDDDAEATEAAGHGTSATTLAATKGITELFVQEDPTIDVSKDAPTNADAIAARLMTSTMGCATAKVTHTMGTIMVGVDFGAGCMLPPLGTVSGSATATVTRVPGPNARITVNLLFTNMAANGTTLNGTCGVSTTTGTSFTVDADLMTATQHVVFSGALTLDSNGMGVTVDGTGTSTVNGISTTDTLAGVHHGFGGCYADAGTITMAKATKTRRGMATNISETMTFSASTPSTGMVMISVNGAAPIGKTLPAYGSCPK
jgi:hypothetical protein